MKNQKIFFLIFYILFFSIWGRVDITRNIYTPGDNSGSWKDWVECIDNTYVYGFDLKQECDYLGTCCTKLFCRALDGSSDSSIVSYEDTEGGYSYSGPRQCSSGDFANSYKMVYNGNGYLSNEISFNDLSLGCVISNTFLVTGYGCGSGTTSPVQTCEPGELICAFRIRWEPNTAYDDNRQSDIDFKCCKICKSGNGFFLQTSTSPPSCATCSRYCKTCSGENDNQCLSCFSGDTANGNSCDRSLNYFEILNEFSSTISTTGFTSNKGTTVGTCGSWGLAGGNGVFGSGDWLQKDFSNQPPFYKIRVKCRLMKIDDWTGHSFKIEVDGHSFSIPEAQSIASNSGALYFGNICGNSLPEDIIDLDSILSYYQATFSVKFSSDLDAGTKYWGIRDLIIGVYKCHDTCMTCTESTDVDCVDCYPHASKVGGKCICDDTYFKVTPHNPCTSYPCIVCTSCFTGCKQCSSASQTDCSSCIASYFLDTNQCVTDCPSTPVSWGDSATLTCVPTCPQVASINQFGDVSDHRICKPCNSNCYTCSGTATHCLSCTGSSYLLSNQCYSTCPTVYYGVPATNLCQDPCPDSEFKHDVDKICYATCPASFFGNPISGKCENPCPSDMYGDSSTHRCEFCDFNCLTCSVSSTHCTGCKYGWTLSSNACQMPQSN